MSKIIGNTTTTPVPRSDWAQTNENKIDFILNKPNLRNLAFKDIVENADLSEDIKESLDKANSAIQNLDGYATEAYVDSALEGKADVGHNHDLVYDLIGAAAQALLDAKQYIDEAVAQKSQVQIITWEADD